MTGRMKRFWVFLGLVFFVSFAVLGLLGGQIYQMAPPVPERVVTTDGAVLMARVDIERGRQVWQSIGGQQVGSVWGHGGYVAPDWSADWIHREATALLDLWSIHSDGKLFSALDAERQAALRARLLQEVRGNTYDPATGDIVVSADRAAAINLTLTHYVDLFGDRLELHSLREAYALAENPVPSKEHRTWLARFFFWTGWAASTNRPGETITYTSNWPSDSLIGNTPTTPTVVWSVVSIVMLLAGVGAMVWYYAVSRTHDDLPAPPKDDPLFSMEATPSMRATAKYFWTVIALFLLQIVLGSITAHYGVEGQDFYGIPLSKWLPYAVTRTWHTQLAIFWIATAWLATGLYIAPAFSGHEPRFQRLGVNVLFLALLVVVLGSMAGEWLGVQQRLGLDVNFWFGHQGYEYIDLGRFWQILLFVGLGIWLLLVGRALWPALQRPSEIQPLLVLLFLSTLAIGLFYGAGLTWGKHTHLAMVEYWRWWVVHLWVEGFFEVFATAVIAILLVRLGLVRVRLVTEAVVFATAIFLLGGILGTLHHLYFAGTPASIIAVGAVFSALEVVPLVLVGFEAYENYRFTQATPWISDYRWPILFFVAVAFWNLVGAGLFGFMINPPISLYYIQGLNTTPVHGHSALFGVYGMLGIGLMLFCLRGLYSRRAWDDRPLKAAFWTLNGGLAAMVLLSLLPVGALQAWASVSHGLWFARSPEFIHQPLIHFLVWMRVPGDVVFGLGAFALAWFAFNLWRGSEKGAKPTTLGKTASASGE